MTQEQCIIEVDRKTNDTANPSIKLWVSKVNNEVENLQTEHSSKEPKPCNKQSIYKVPSSVKDLCRKAYTPQKVSIGPYHHGEERLKGMEEHKHRALLHFLKRSKKPLQCYVDALARVVEELKDAYDQLDDKWKQDTEAFLELTIVDGCFVLELMRNTIGSSDDLIEMGYGENDPVFGYHGMLNIVPHLKRDILMLENQLPLLVLVTLFGVENDMPMIRDDLEQQKAITMLILKFLCQPAGDEIEQMGKCLHILHLYQRSLRPYQNIKTNIIRRSNYYQQEYGIIPSATDLRSSGIRFKQSKTRSLTDISFHRGVLKLPLVVVDDAFESDYLNLMAFERYHVGAGSDVTSYVFFMSCLIRNAEDARLLSSCDVIKNVLRRDQAVADSLNSLSNDIKFDPNSILNQVQNQVIEYSQSILNRWRADLLRTYFSSPEWMITGLVLYLTILQTVFTVLSYAQSYGSK